MNLYSLLDTSHAVQKSQDFKIGTVRNNKISNNQILNKCIIGKKERLKMLSKSPCIILKLLFKKYSLSHNVVHYTLIFMM